jgi:3-methyladenine DNA glycosylase AlkD
MPISPTTAITRALRNRLKAAGDPKRAKAQQAYMKSAMPYAGVPMSDVRSIARDVLGELEFDNAAHWMETIRALWRAAQVREERYAAIALARSPRHRALRTPAALPLYEELIVTGAWWDFVDEIASHLVGELLTRYPKPLRKTLTAWSRDDDLWKRRTAIIAQLGFKGATDAALLFRWIEPSLSSNEFFLRKAIGWALREYSKSAPDVVRRYVAERVDMLSPLSRREALKVIERGYRGSA